MFIPTIDLFDSLCSPPNITMVCTIESTSSATAPADA